MPFNLLLLPLLAGYLVLARSNIRAYSTVRLSKEQLLLHASLSGLMLLVASRISCYFAKKAWLGQLLGETLYSIAPFPYVGTALGTLVLAGALIALSNFFVDESLAARWLYHRGNYDLMSEILWRALLGDSQRSVPGPALFTCRVAKSVLTSTLCAVSWTQWWRLPSMIAVLQRFRTIELFSLDAGDTSRSVMLQMRDGKVIVGFVTQIKVTTAVPDFVMIAPIWTGYRDGASNQVVKSVVYGAVLQSGQASGNLNRVIRVDDIAWGTLFDSSAFDFPSTETCSAPTGPSTKPRIRLKSRSVDQPSERQPA